MSKRKQTQNQYSRRGSIFEKLKVLGERVPGRLNESRDSTRKALAAPSGPPFQHSPVKNPTHVKNSQKTLLFTSESKIRAKRNQRETKKIFQEEGHHQRKQLFTLVNRFYSFLIYFLVNFWVIFYSFRLFSRVPTQTQQGVPL